MKFLHIISRFKSLTAVFCILIPPLLDRAWLARWIRTAVGVIGNGTVRGRHARRLIKSDAIYQGGQRRPGEFVTRSSWVVKVTFLRKRDNKGTLGKIILMAQGANANINNTDTSAGFELL